MKEIKWLAEKIEEEIHDAEEYARAANHYKESDKELSRCCASLAEEELKHSDILHRQAVRLIQEHIDKGHETPPAMQAVWDWEHEKMVDRKAYVRHLLNGIAG